MADQRKIKRLIRCEFCEISTGITVWQASGGCSVYINTEGLCVQYWI